MSLNIVKDWVEFTKIYPPAEIFFQQSKDKQERRCKAICEELFTLEPTGPDHPSAKLREMWSRWRDLEVIFKLGIEDMKREEVVTIAAIFKQVAKEAIRAMEVVYKKDQQLWQHYKDKSLTVSQVNATINAEIYKTKGVDHAC